MSFAKLSKRGPGAAAALAVWINVFASLLGLAQSAGELDVSFNPGSGINGAVEGIVVQPDGKILIRGQFSTVAGAVRPRIARLNPDGTADRDFERTGFNAWAITAMLLQPDGKVLIVGLYAGPNDANRCGIARLQADGSRDRTFQIPTFDERSDPSDQVVAMALQPDGKVLIGGAFTEVAGVNRSKVARLNSDGSLDLSFDAGVIEGIPGETGSTVSSVAVQSDGRIVIGGMFFQIRGGAQTPRSLARLTPDGTLDPTFDAQLKADTWISWLPWVRSIVVQPDDKLLIAGYFIGNLVRLNADGTHDISFTPPTVEKVSALTRQSDGRILVAAQFPTNFVGSPRVVRLHAEGGFDPSFEGPTVAVSSIGIQADGRVLIGGAFPGDNGSINYLARLKTDGTRDDTFDPGSGINHFINAVLVQPDEKIVIGGSFTMIRTASRIAIARLQRDGSLDPDFNAGLIEGRPSFDPWVDSVLQQPDGKLLVAGGFTHIKSVSGSSSALGEVRHGLARLKTNGVLDMTFVPPESANLDHPFVLAVALQLDGKVLVAHPGMKIDGVSQPSGVARLHTNGSLDPTFRFAEADGFPQSMLVQDDGKVLVLGNFKTIAGANRTGLARLHADGTPDTGFNPVLDEPAESLALQADQKMLVGGWFTTVNGSTRRWLARLNPDGSLDSHFNATLTGPVRRMIMQADGRVLATFTDVNGMVDGLIVRLNPDGRLDSGFNTTANNMVRSFALQSDGKVLVAGDFVAINGIARTYVARLHLGPQLESITLVDPAALPDGRFRFLVSGGLNRSYTVQCSPDLATWSDLKTVVPTNASFTIEDETAVAFSRRYYRVFATSE